MTKPMNISDVLMDRFRVLAIVKDNRARHRDIFEEAMEGYRRRAIEILEEHIQRIKDKDMEQVNVALPMPEDHTDDYDRVISMLEDNLAGTVVLDERDYKTFILDDWGWKREWTATNTMYAGSV